MLTKRFARIALTTALTLSLAAGVTAGPIQVTGLTIETSTNQNATPSPGVPGVPIHLLSSDSENWLSPGPFTHSGSLGDGVAVSSTSRLAPFSEELIYSSARQSSASNAVAVRHVYDAKAGTVDLLAQSFWTVFLAGSPIDFSFFLSGGAIEAWCAVCITGGLTAEISASLTPGGGGGASLWSFGAKLSWPVHGEPTLVISGRDPLGLGSPNVTISKPSDADHYFRMAIDPFHAGPFDVGAQTRLHYNLSASVQSVGSAYATAWLTDPFELGQEPGSLPSSGFTINGESIESLLAVGPAAPGVPEPGTLLLLLAGLGGFATAGRRGRSRAATMQPAAAKNCAHKPGESI